MNDQLVPALNQLASKLGVAADHIYAVLLRQARIEAIANLVWALIWVLIGAAAIYASYRCAKFHKEDRCNDYHFGAWILGVCSVIPILLCVLFLIEGITYFVNPDYYVLQRVLSVLRGN